MVVTRRMAKQKIENSSKDHKKKIQQCCIKIHRLSPAEIEQLSNPDSKTLPTKKHNLRYKPPSVPKPIKKKPKNMIAKATKDPVKLWNELTKSRCSMPPNNAVVLSKMKSYSPWPSKLVAVKNNKALVYFFGTNNHGEVKTADVIRFEDGPELIKVLSMKKIKDYRKAVREAELFMSVPPEKSILNEVYAMNP